MSLYSPVTTSLSHEIPENQPSGAQSLTSTGNSVKPTAIEKRRQSAIARIKQRPGLDRTSLTTALGLSLEQVNSLLEVLFLAGEIRLSCDRFSDTRKPVVRSYPVDWEPIEAELFKPASGYQNRLKTWFDPTVRTDYQQVRRAIEDLPTATAFRINRRGAS